MAARKLSKMAGPHMPNHSMYSCISSLLRLSYISVSSFSFTVFLSTINFNFLCWLYFSSFCGRMKGDKRKQERWERKREENIKGGREREHGRRKEGSPRAGVKAVPQRPRGGRDQRPPQRPGQQRPVEVTDNSELLKRACPLRGPPPAPLFLFMY